MSIHTIPNGIFGYVATLNKDLIQIIVPGLGKVNVTRLMKTVSYSGHYRIQFPIMVCTFMTIHKSMGLNLPKLICLNRVSYLWRCLDVDPKMIFVSLTAI
ncbi:hypothetical protein O9G_005251 [Rozella allomycis CSF55]|uniref:Uncharacterized protein n=1 Tax=Rozella allomycis (strain CSF55) TaxID=988480 RepID=A0A075AU26_ROZAC|nr:hypothetical protein O9G_005251 [Rozella allomycis CSF55]|eukprot:EPZ33768.1 hypothetical protein O9G_005251 [Rozella allomycis CSF55]